MNCKLLSGLAVVALGWRAFGQTADFYENNGTVLVPPAIAPNIDARNFVNRGQFVINFTNGPFIEIPIDPPPIGLPPYETQNTLNYSNLFGHLMSCNTGFRLENFNSQSGQRQRASSFYNAGIFNCGTTNTTNFLTFREAFFGTTNVAFFGVAGSKMIVNATNIVSPGTINMGFESLLSLRGNSVDMTRSTITSEPEGFSVSSGANLGFFFNQGIFDGYWGVGDPVTQRPLFYPGGITPPFYFEFNPPSTPIHPVRTRDQQLILQELIITNAVTYLLDTFDPFTPNTRLVRAVFLGNTNANVHANVYFPFFPDIAIEYTNILGTASNNLYILDYFGVLTNLQLVINGFAGNQTTFIPFNYSVFFENPAFINPFLGPLAPPTPIPPGTFTQTAVTNQWSAYQALLQPLTVFLADQTGQDVTNLPGRIEIVADKFLDLSRTRISGLNYLAIKSTNHFAGSSRAQISAAVADISLRSTNGLLTITNLLYPAVGHPEGDIKLFSARWTNIASVGGVFITNKFHVLFADGNFSSTTPARIQDLILRSTNTPGGSDSIVINDVLNVTRSLLLETSRITIATNDPGSPTLTGGINILSSSITWPTSTPRLQYLTNNGFIQAANSVFFGGSRSSPYYSSTFNEPYEVFVNHGVVTNFGSLIWAKIFQNTGTFFASGGDIQLQQAQTALLTDGAFLAGGDIGIAGGDVFVSNHVFQAGAALTLSATVKLDDGSFADSSADFVTNRNIWTVTNGFNLPVLAPQASLLGTTVTSTAPVFAEVVNRWAGADRGCVADGYTNNAALGRLILDGGDESQFTFTGANAANALYVDYLELKNFTTNRNSMGDFIGVQIDPNMKIYFAQAIANGVSIAEKLDGRNGGRFCWVSSYAGTFSSTNVVYPDGSTNRFNIALVTSCNLDSDGDGIVNCADSTPIPVPFSPASIALRVTVANSPPLTASVSWNSQANAMNYLYSKSSLAATNWQLVTNFVSGPVSGRVTLAYPTTPNGSFYRVRVDVP